MMTLDRNYATMCLSTSEIEGRDREAAIRELFARGYLNIDIDFLTDHQLLEASVWQFPGLAVATGKLTKAKVSSHDPTSQDDTVIFGGGFGASAILHCRHREVSSGHGESVMFRGSDRMWSENLEGWIPRTLRIEARLIEGLLPDLDDRTMRQVGAESPALGLLDQYLPLICVPAVMNSPRLAQAAVQHVVDLVTLAVGATGDVAHEASTRGYAAARSAGLKDWVRRRVVDPSLSLAQAAQAYRVSSRTVQEMFHREQTSFSEFVLMARLEQAHSKLCNPLHDGELISTVAFGVGFNDLSYFNRRFRQRFGHTPSDVRAAARQSTP